MDHPFEIGKTYRNRKGAYEVLTIEETDMRVRYEDGRQETLFINTQILAWSIWQDMPEPPPPVVKKSARRKGKQPTQKLPSKPSRQEKLIAEILKEDKAIYEILAGRVIPPGQIDLYRLLLQHPDDYFSIQEIADQVRGGDRQSEQSVLRAFGNRIKGSSDERVKSVSPYNRLFFEEKHSGGKTLLRIRPRVREIFQSYPKFYDFLINDTRSWLPDEFGSEHWKHTPEIHRNQLAFFGFSDLDRGSRMNEESPGS